MTILDRAAYDHATCLVTDSLWSFVTESLFLHADKDAPSRTKQTLKDVVHLLNLTIVGI